MNRLAMHILGVLVLCVRACILNELAKALTCWFRREASMHVPIFFKEKYKNDPCIHAYIHTVIIII